MPDNDYGSFKLLYSQQANEIQEFDFNELAARASASYGFQLRHKTFETEGRGERVLATNIDGETRSIKNRNRLRASSNRRVENHDRRHQVQLGRRSNANGLDQKINCTYYHRKQP